MKANESTKTTKTVAGYKITLQIGRRYLATRPFAGAGFRKGGVEWFPVMIVSAEDPLGPAIDYVDDMSYDNANAFLAAFNNGEMSFDGRIW